MNGLDVYRETAVTTQSGGKLIVLLYDGAIRFLKLAIDDLKNKDYASKGKHIVKAQDIIDELNTILDMESGGEISTNLRSLYNFMNRHLSQAHYKNDVGKIQEVIRLLEELNQAWRAISN